MSDPILLVYAAIGVIFVLYLLLTIFSRVDKPESKFQKVLNKLAKAAVGGLIGYVVIKLVMMVLYETLFKSSSVNDFFVNALIACCVIIFAMIAVSDFITDKKDKS